MVGQTESRWLCSVVKCGNLRQCSGDPAIVLSYTHTHTDRHTHTLELELKLETGSTSPNNAACCRHLEALSIMLALRLVAF